MLLFYPVEEGRLSILAREGTPAGAAFLPSLEVARRQRAAAVLVVDTSAHPALSRSAEDVPALPPSAFENLQPYCPPEDVTAGGGYVLRAEEHGLPLAARRLLLIYRRGVWDLPKGKQEPGETPRACALREVQEETGLGEVRVLGALGATVHGYREERPEGPRYRVKTTLWFLMETPEHDLDPQRAEGIEEAAWVAWEEVGGRLGYETLRRHYRRAEAQVRGLLEGRSASNVERGL